MKKVIDMQKLHEYPDEYFESLGFRGCGQHEWENDVWTIEYLGTNERPDCWRIDDFKNEGRQILFLDIKGKEELEWLLKAVNAI